MPSNVSFPLLPNSEILTSLHRPFFVAPRYPEALKVLYTSTKFVFAQPMDIHCLQELASPEGLASVRTLIIPFGNVDRWFHWTEVLQEWNGAFRGLGRMPALRELQIWMYHPGAEKAAEPARERRPWEEKNDSDVGEQNHRELFELFGTARLPDFTVNLTWNPEDVFARREWWPFKVNVLTYDECHGTILQFPYAVDDPESLYI
jgi:hypothetical protein